jgi:hypothetical protein
MRRCEFRKEKQGEVQEREREFRLLQRREHDLAKHVRGAGDSNPAAKGSAIRQAGRGLTAAPASFD